jgi:hypothetical protein
MSLREEWPTLSSRERDARVAKALGIRPDITWEIVTSGGGATAFSRDSETAARAWLAEKHANGMLLTHRVEAWTHHPNSSTWAVAGPLLDKLREEGWAQIDVRFRVDADIWRCHIYSGADLSYEEFHAQGVGPSAIALAFCLSREVALG